jgi:hypothetical protein
MFWKKRKGDIKYSWHDGHMDYGIDNFIIPASSKVGGCPFHKMKTFYSGAKNVFDDMRIKHENLYYGKGENHVSKTLRLCPGVSELFSKTYVLRSPIDFVLSYDLERNILLTTPNGTGQDPRLDISQHPIEQTEIDGGGNLLEGKIALKFRFPISIYNENSYIFHDAIWHNPSCFRIFPGIISSRSTMDLQFFAHFELPKKIGELRHINVKSGDALAYMIFDEPMKLIKVDDLDSNRARLRSKFIRGIEN